MSNRALQFEELTNQTKQNHIIEKTVQISVVQCD